MVPNQVNQGYITYLLIWAPKSAWGNFAQ